MRIRTYRLFPLDKCVVWSTSGFLLATLSNARRAPCPRSLFPENAHPIKCSRKPEMIAPPKSVKGARGLEAATSCATSRLLQRANKICACPRECVPKLRMTEPASVHEGFYPILSQYAEIGAQAVQSEPNAVFSSQQVRGEPERNHPS